MPVLSLSMAVIMHYDSLMCSKSIILINISANEAQLTSGVVVIVFASGLQDHGFKSQPGLSSDL